MHKMNVFAEFMMRVRRKARRVPLLLIFMTLTSYFQAGQSVWSLGIPNQASFLGSIQHYCYAMGLNEEQAELCLENRELIVGVRYGARLAEKQCEYQFQYRRWNCSIPERDRNSLFHRITGTGTRESAFTYAISTAGVAYYIARQCAIDGDLKSCGCSRERRPKEVDKMAKEEEGVQFDWGGCGDNIQFGTSYAKQFMNAGEGGGQEHRDMRDQERARMNKHNNEVGVQVIKGSSEITCKCHGVSQSCALRTCWRELVDFSEIGKKLQQKYDSASRVRYDRRTGKFIRIKKTKEAGLSRRGGKRRSSRIPTYRSLVFIDSSPNYCVRSRRHQTVGTKGRECKINSDGGDSCTDLCCGRGYQPAEVVTKEKCQCKFYWCCTVKCKQCLKRTTKYYCL
ncbi:protein Wnt-5a-like isoform X3 [Porites lutea]|uniref:protein Wnt-5a-like isoform X3 n=2 Tax=Porites lutea TaxID=51062 RepID=UPI003CC5186F